MEVALVPSALAHLDDLHLAHHQRGYNNQRCASLGFSDFSAAATIIAWASLRRRGLAAVQVAAALRGEVLEQLLRTPEYEGAKNLTLKFIRPAFSGEALTIAAEKGKFTVRGEAALVEGSVK